MPQAPNAVVAQIVGASIHRANERVERYNAWLEEQPEWVGSTRTRLRSESEYLIAEGDSWFHLPDAVDLVDALRRFGYEVRSVAHHGDALHSMAYLPAQLDSVAEECLQLHRVGVIPKAILLSGGGNDLTQSALDVLLHDQRSESPGSLNVDVVAGAIHVRLRDAYLRWLSLITELCSQVFVGSAKRVPIVLHGYANPIPDGRRYRDGKLFYPGPWLEPAFVEHGYTNLDDRTDMMKRILGELNLMLQRLGTEQRMEHVRYVDVRDIPKEKPPQHTEEWIDELHLAETPLWDISVRFAHVIDDYWSGA